MSTATMEPTAVHATLRDFVSRRTTEVSLPSAWTVEFATRELARALELPETTAENQPQAYELFRRPKEGQPERLLPGSTIGDAVEEGDEIEPMPEVVPGQRTSR